MPYRVILICLLMCLYLLVANVRVQSADGYAILATAQTGNINIMGAVDYVLVPQGRMGTLGEDGVLYSKKGITPSLALMPLVWANHALPDAPLQATAHLFNMLISTITAVMLFNVVMQLGYTQRTAFSVAVMFGLGSLYLVYTRTLFGEPLAGLLLLWIIHKGLGTNTSYLHIGILIGAMAGINLSYLAFLPIFVIYHISQNPRQWHKTLWMLIGTFITTGVLVGMVNLARYGTLTETGYKFDAGEGFSTPLFDGLYGLFLSPMRGIVWYMPLVWLMPIGWCLFHKSHARLAWLVIVCVMVQAGIYAMWWSWHGGIVWGARFLLPIIPIAMLCLPPLIERADGAWRVGIWMVFGVSFAMQLLGTLYDFNPHEGMLYARYPEAVQQALAYHPHLSPIIANIQQVLRGEAITWLWHGWGWLMIATIIILPLAMVVIRNRVMPILALIGVVIGMGMMLYTTEADSDKQARHALQSALSPSAPIIALTDDTTFINLRGVGHITSIYAPTAPDEPFIAQLWTNATADAGMRWLVTWYDPANPDNWAERNLFTHHAFMDETWAGGYRAIGFYLHPPAMPPLPTAWRFGEAIGLASYGILRDDDGLFLHLTWEALATIPNNWTWFVHVLDADGNIIAQQDRTPLGGFMPTLQWTMGDMIAERLYFAIASEDARALRIGWVDGGVLVPVDDADGAMFVILDV